MPFYHKKYGEYGRRNTNQVTKKWFKGYKLANLEKDGMRKLKNAERQRIARQEHEQKHFDALQNKKLDQQRKQADEHRRIESLMRATLDREVCQVRLDRLNNWGRENVERAQAYSAELQRQTNQENERKRQELLFEHEGRKSMAHEEHLTLRYLETTRTLPEQVLLRKWGFIEGKPRAKILPSALAALDDVGFHVVNAARQNLHVIELHLIQPQPVALDDDDSDFSGDEADANMTVEEEEQAWQDKMPPKMLSVELTKFPQAVEINCIRLRKEGVRLLARTIAPPPIKAVNHFRGFGKGGGGNSVPEPIEIVVPNLLHLNLERNNIQRMGMRALVKCFERGGCPKLKTLNLSSNNIEDGGMKCLTDMVLKKDGQVLTHLRTLVLRLNVIGDLGACALCHVLLQSHLPALTSIDLKMNQIKFRGAHAMLSFAASSTVRNKKFQMLNLSGNFIDRQKLGRFARETPTNCCL